MALFFFFIILMQGVMVGDAVCSYGWYPSERKLLFVVGKLERVRSKIDNTALVRATLLLCLLGAEALALGHNHVQMSSVSISLLGSSL